MLRGGLKKLAKLGNVVGSKLTAQSLAALDDSASRASASDAPDDFYDVSSVTVDERLPTISNVDGLDTREVLSYLCIIYNYMQVTTVK